MFEFDKYERALHKQGALKPAKYYQPVANIDKMSLLFWSEHCIECAIPDCYSSCDLYQSRPDFRCRRFEYGLYKNHQFSSLRGYGAELTFKRWGKLETRGNTAMSPVKNVRRQEHIIERLVPLSNFLGTALQRFSQDQRWAYLTFVLLERWIGRIHRTRKNELVPDGFLLEIYNPAVTAIRLQITMFLSPGRGPGLVREQQLRTRFSRTVACKPGYSRHEIDAAAFTEVIKTNKPFDIALIPQADTHPNLVVLSADFVIYKKEKERRSNIKCVVFDLDNTIWDGVLLENEQVELKPGMVELFRYLDERGILMSIVSKNDHQHAWQRMEKLGIAEYFLYPQINWQPKSHNIKTIAECLNIGIDTFAFVDDNVFELDEVNQMLPMIVCVNAAEVDNLISDQRFAGSVSSDAKNRRSYYNDAIYREQEQVKFGNDYIGFLRSCEIQLTIELYQSAHLQRIAELVQRTNQLNFSGHKYNRKELNRLLEDTNLTKYILSCQDKYGTHGIVGFSLVIETSREIRVEDFMLSCRVQGKFIEQAFFNYICKYNNPYKARLLRVNYHQTARNKPAYQVLNSLNLKPAHDDGSMVLDLSRHNLSCDFITVNVDRLS